MQKPSIVAIDGPGGVGKNAVGRLLAQRLGYKFLDTGAMYRAITWLALEERVPLEDEVTLGRLAAQARIRLNLDPGQAPIPVFVNGLEASQELRSAQVEAKVSLVARVAGVRQPLVAEQRRLAQGGKIVVVGRDIGTVVLPEAGLKVFLEASPEERARRRYLELRSKGLEPKFASVLAELSLRDRLDSERPVSPLRPAPDARRINTDGLSLDEVVARVYSLWEDP